MESRFLNEVAEVARTGNGFLDYILINDASSILVLCFRWPYSIS